MADGVRLSQATMRAVFPDAPNTIIAAFVEKQSVLLAVGLNQTRQRLAFCFANLHAETSGAWRRCGRNRFASAAAVQARYGTAPGWQLKALDDIYGNGMGNRPGTADGSRFISRGGPQVTGRDGYDEIGKRIGVDLVSAPDLAGNHALQPDIAAAFWDWKGMSRLVDGGSAAISGCRLAASGEPLHGVPSAGAVPTFCQVVMGYALRLWRWRREPGRVLPAMATCCGCSSKA